MKILILGTGDLRNYGCEAIVQGTYRILKDAFPDCKIHLASDNPAYDRQFLPEDITLVSYKRRFTPYRILKGILRRVFKIGKGSPVRMNTSLTKHYDIYLAAGGDNYCQRPDHGIYTLLEDMMALGKTAHRHNCRYILWGSSIGPFDRDNIRRRVIGNLSLSDAILVREKKSEAYIKSFPALADRCHLVADPAFMMEPGNYPLPKEKGKKYIGINLSDLAITHMGLKSNDVIPAFANQLKELQAKHPDWVYVGIPHVQLGNPPYVQNDFTVLNPLEQLFADKARFFNLPADLGARNTKAAVSQLDMLVAARMHACVAGISTGVPTLFLTYSNKGSGMAQYAYNPDSDNPESPSQSNSDSHSDSHSDSNWTITIPDILTPLFPEMMVSMMKQRDRIAACLTQSLPRFHSESQAAAYVLL